MFPFTIAIRFLKSNLSQTILIVVGISVGVSVQVFIGSLISGLQQDLINTTIGSSSQVTITSENDDYIDSYQTIKTDIESSVDGVESISFALDQTGTLVMGSDTSPILLRGFDLSLADSIYDIEDKITEGSLPKNDNEILISTTLQTEYDISVNDTITISIPLVGSQTATVVGIYDFRVASINNSWIITTLPTVQNYLNQEDVVSAIEMQVTDVFAAETISSNISDLVYTSGLEVSNWIEQNEDLLGGLEAQSSSSLMIQVFVTISVVLGITSVLAITVIQKSRQIGILKAMGIKDRQASLIFLSEGFLLGVMGAIGGIILGLLLSWSFSTFAVDSAGEPIVPLLIDPVFISISGVIAIIAASIASILPARRSSKLSVIEVIRNG